MEMFLDEYGELNNKGVQLGANGDYKEAIELFNKAIKINPQREEAYANIANTYDDLSQHEKAIEFYNKAISINPKNASHYFNLGVIYGNLSKKSSNYLVDLDKPYSTTQVKRYKENANQNFLKAAYYGDKESISILNKVGIDVKNNETIKDELFDIAFNKKMANEDYQSAKDIFNFILYNESENISALQGLGSCYYNLGLDSDQKMKIKDALAFYERTIKYCLQLLDIEPKNKIACNMLGLSYYAAASTFVNTNDLTKAIEYLNKAKILVEEQKDIVLELLAQSYYYNEQNEKAEKTLNELSSLTGKDTSTILDESKKTKYFKFLVKGNKYENNNNWEKAIEYYDKAIALMPDNQDAYYNKGACYERKGDFSEALKIYKIAAKLDPQGEYTTSILKNIERIKNNIRNSQHNLFDEDDSEDGHWEIY